MPVVAKKYFAIQYLAHGLSSRQGRELTTADRPHGGQFSGRMRRGKVVSTSARKTSSRLEWPRNGEFRLYARIKASDRLSRIAASERK